MHDKQPANDRVIRLAGCELQVGAGAWPFAERNRVPIDAHWDQRTRANPGFFNGLIHLLESHELKDGCLTGRLMPVEFKSFLYWKDTGYPDATVRDAFGSALIRSAEGHVLLGRQRAGNLNAGLAYLPGGFIDGRDIDASGLVDIDASVVREVLEETGLGAADLERRPGYVLTFAGAMVSIGVEYGSRLSARELKARILRHIAADTQSELVEVEIVQWSGDLDRIAMPIYAEVLLRMLFRRP